jgi:hypothetical protein
MPTLATGLGQTTPNMLHDLTSAISVVRLLNDWGEHLAIYFRTTKCFPGIGSVRDALQVDI